MPTRPLSILLIILLHAGIAVHAQPQRITKDQLRQRELDRYAMLAKRTEYTSRAADQYDAIHYRLDITLTVADTAFGGSVTMTLKSVVPMLDTVVLNAEDAMAITSVTSGGTPLTFTHETNLLRILLPAGLPRDQVTSVTVSYRVPYAGSPITKRQVQNVDLNVNTTSISSQSEPYDARGWWPCKDDPNDKADSVDIVVTTDTALTVVSNGLRISDIRSGARHTVHWKTRYPTVTYLVMVALARYNYSETQFTHGGKTIPVGNWFYGMSGTDMAPNETAMLEGLQVYSDLFITYPFMNEKYGMAEYEAFGGAMEHQTCSSMGFYGTSVVVHELAHQWFGDKVTCADFGHIWLNEGWATYCEALFDESRGGLAALRANMAGNAYYGPGTIFVSDAENKGMSEIFNGNLSYNKASWVVHMLRHVVGDRAFFAAVRKYLGSDARENYRSVTTKEFQTYLEQESGKDLEPFIRNWIYGEYYPTYKVLWNAVPAGSEFDVTVGIEQLYVPQRQIFDMPIDLTFAFAGFDTTIVVHNNTQTATYTFRFPRKPKSIFLDKDDWILKRVVQPLVNPTFDQGILVVNGVDWDVESYTAEIKSAYQDSCFTGNRPYTLWDLFPNPSTGYPPNTPAPAGAGSLPGEELGKYCTVVWIGNAYNGDDVVWGNTSIMEYLKAGGNVILISRMGRTFITTELQQLLGITWTQGGSQTARSCNAVQSYLADMPLKSEQTLINFFSPTLTRPENTLLFTDDAGANPLGLGVWGKPMLVDGKATGHMMFIGLRPYRIDHPALRANMQTLLDSLPCTPSPPLAVNPTPSGVVHFRLGQGYPNPVSLSRDNAVTFDIDVSGAVPEPVILYVHDALGRRVFEALNETLSPGRHTVTVRLQRLTPGFYSCVLQGGSAQTSRAMLVIR